MKCKKSFWSCCLYLSHSLMDAFMLLVAWTVNCCKRLLWVCSNDALCIFCKVHNVTERTPFCLYTQLSFFWTFISAPVCVCRDQFIYILMSCTLSCTLSCTWQYVSVCTFVFIFFACKVVSKGSNFVQETALSIQGMFVSIYVCVWVQTC